MAIPNRSTYETLLAAGVLAYGSTSEQGAACAARLATELQRAGVPARGLDRLLIDAWRDYEACGALDRRRKAAGVLGSWRPDEYALSLVRESAILARIPTLDLGHENSDVAADLRLQRDPVEGAEVAQMLAHPGFQEAGRFPGYPLRGNCVSAVTCHDQPEGQPAPSPQAVDSRRASQSVANEVGQTMDRHWSFLHRRGMPDRAEINSLTRSVYNARGLGLITGGAEGTHRAARRVLCCSGYESPLSLLLEQEQVEQVVVADLSREAAIPLQAKYPVSIASGRLAPIQADFSGIDPKWQSQELGRLGRSSEMEVAFTRHFESLATGAMLQPLPFGEGEFDAIHAPFVLGSLHMAVVTAAVAAAVPAPVDLGEVMGESLLSSRALQSAQFVVIRHVLTEFERILAPGGLLIVNLWARPVEFEGQRMVKFSDTESDRGSD